jgi:hypothetical protein
MKDNISKYVSLCGEDEGMASVIWEGLPITPHIPIDEAFAIARGKGIQTDWLWCGKCGKFEENMGVW